jgi:7-carboxy-7-deazaguanine synthase
MFITEIFKSIQGEGTRAGLPCIFVRLTGCNLRCTWCDTAYAFHGGAKISIAAVAARVHELAGHIPGATSGASNSVTAVPLVELTGGEPLLQEENLPAGPAITHFGVHRNDRNQRRALHRQITARSD